MAVLMAHPVIEGVRTARERFALRRRLGRSGQLRLAERLERYVSPACAGCGERHRDTLAVVSAAGNVWWLCVECSARARALA